jgi:hypothetical protein
MEHIDGAFFGRSFPHVFMQRFPELKPPEPEPFVASIWGFQVHCSSQNHPAKMLYNRTSSAYEVIPRPDAHFAPDQEADRYKATLRAEFVRPHKKS